MFGVTTDGTAQPAAPPRPVLVGEHHRRRATRPTRTVVMGNEDAGGGQLWVLRRHQADTGDAFDKAGLHQRRSTTWSTRDSRSANDAAVPQPPTARPTGKVRVRPRPRSTGTSPGADAERRGRGRGADAQPDRGRQRSIRRNRNDYYFLTTEGGDAHRPGVRDGGGLWRLTFDNVEKPELGGTLELLLDGSEALGLNKPDNLTIDDQAATS